MNYGVSESGELVVEMDSGGWLSGPAADPEAGPEDVSGPPREYGLNIVALMADYPDFVILGEPHGNGWKAYQRGRRSRAIGEGVRGLTLDRLALEMNRVRRRIDGA
jgi:hypothetical protein